jgi:hypothetical protein
MSKTKLLIGTATAAAALSWLWTDLDPVAAEFLTVTPRSALIRPEGSFVAGSESSDPVDRPGFIAASRHSSPGTDTGAREAFSDRREKHDPASVVRQQHGNAPNRKEEEIMFGQSARQTGTGPDRAINSLKSPPPIPRSSGLMTPEVPASWVQVPDSPYLTSRQQEEIQPMAEALLAAFQAAGQQGGTSEMEISTRNAAIRSSDAEFRRKYGQHAWMEHHIQAYHLGLAP